MTSTSGPTVRQALQEAQRRLTAGSIPIPALDARVLLQHALDLNSTDLFLRLDEPLRDDQAKSFTEAVTRRLTGEPVAYLTGQREFYGLDLRVTPSVLIPRPETELLVEQAIRHLPTGARVVDVGAGSGAIAVAVAHHRSDVHVLAIDRSLAACRIALGNVCAHGLQRRVSVICADLISAVKMPFDAVLANLPYLRHDELAGLPSEVRREPQSALDGGQDGLAVYRRLFSTLTVWRPRPAFVLCEIAPMQYAAMATLVATALPHHRTQVLPDLAGRSRLVEARLTPDSSS